MNYCTGYDYCAGYPYVGRDRSVHAEMDPDAILDWRFEWMMGNDTLLTSEFTVEGASEVESSFDASSATIVIQGGSAGRIVTIRNRVTTQQGRRGDATRRIRIREF